VLALLDRSFFRNAKRHFFERDTILTPTA
jgi:hypothetical protein